MYQLEDAIRAIEEEHGMKDIVEVLQKIAQERIKVQDWDDEWFNLVNDFYHVLKDIPKQ